KIDYRARRRRLINSLNARARILTARALLRDCRASPRNLYDNRGAEGYQNYRCNKERILERGLPPGRNSRLSCSPVVPELAPGCMIAPAHFAKQSLQVAIFPVPHCSSLLARSASL